MIEARDRIKNRLELTLQSNKLVVFTWIVIGLLVLPGIYMLFAKRDEFYATLFLLVGIILQVPSVYCYSKYVKESFNKQSIEENEFFLKFIFILISPVCLVTIFVLYVFPPSEIWGGIGIAITIIIMISIMLYGWIIYHNPETCSNGRIISYDIVLYFLGIFVCISNIMALSIMHYDTANNHSSLYYDNVIYKKETFKAVEISKDKRYKDTVIVIGNDTTDIKMSELNSEIYFDNSSSTVELKESKTATDKIKSKNTNTNKEYNHSQFSDIYKEANCEVINRAIEILGILSKKTNLRIRITLMGHASDEPIAGKATTFKSNYEISSSRTQSVQAKLLEYYPRKAGEVFADGTRKAYNIEWLLIPASNQNNYLNKYQPKSALERRVVQINIAPILNHYSEALIDTYQAYNDLKIFDYMYFMFYTITTTGYRDIKPIDGFAKFTTSMANLYEFIFLVIFFNLLISLRRKESGVTSLNEENKKSA